MGEESNRTHDVFLSYSSKDKTWADSACAVLEKHRIRCWIAPRDMIPGDEWAAGIIKGLNASRIMVLIFSDDANALKQVRKEVERAISKELPVLAFRIQNVEPKDAMEFNLSNIHWLDAFTPPVERQMELLAGSVKKLLGRDPEQKPPGTGAGPDDPPPPTRPRAFWPIAIAASIFGLVALGVLVMAIQARNGGSKTPVPTNSSNQAVRGDESHANPPVDSAGARPQTSPSAPKLIPPAGPARLAQSVNGGSWTVEGDQLVEEGSGHGSVGFGDEGWRDYDLTFEFRQSAGGTFDVGFRSDEWKGYALAFLGDKIVLLRHSRARNKRYPDFKKKGGNSEIQSMPGTIRPGERYKLKISVRGPVIGVDLDEHTLFTCTDYFSQKGSVGGQLLELRHALQQYQGYRPRRNRPLGRPARPAQRNDREPGAKPAPWTVLCC